MPRQTVTQNRQDALKIADQLVQIQKTYGPLVEERENLKIQIRGYGPQSYVLPDGTVVVSEPEVRKFTGRELTVDYEKALDKLTRDQFKTLEDLGVFVWVDNYTSNAASKVETTLT